jgi:hypothetical protein
MSWLERMIGVQASSSMGRAVVAVAAMLVLTLPGCLGSDDDGGDKRDTSPDRELLARLSAGIAAQGRERVDEIFYTDISGARRDAGLPADADVNEVNSDPNAIRLSTVVTTALSYTHRPKPTPLSESIDGTKVQTAAALAFIADFGVVVLRTKQPFAEIARSLRRRGYKESGNRGFLISPAPRARLIYPVVADGGDGVVILAGNVRVARAALAGENTELTPGSRLIEDVPGVARAAAAGLKGCVRARAAGQDLMPQEGEYLVLVEGRPDAKRLKLAGGSYGGLQGVKVGETETDGRRLRAEFTVNPREDIVGGDLPYMVMAIGPPDESGIPGYDCP